MKRRGQVPVSRQSEQHFVTRNQQIGLAADCENQEFLIVRIAAAR